MIVITLDIPFDSSATKVKLFHSLDQGRQFTCPGELVTFTCHVSGSIFLKWRSPGIRSITYTANDMPPSPRTQGPFEANLTLVNSASVDSNITSTLRMTEPMDEVSVDCLNANDRETENLNITGISHM